ncbi:DNA polymerase/3'-5' exonuclease PolX [Streptomyces sp. 3MP-14]|uniref:DNA polymerase beta n=1 Tax=Streptomyces mimosae TaxID=2586635 RepID=A0A5N6AS78_9ACTN|nr:MULTISPECIES: DNA polymerase/3'-5' exonuclease PolX [Streptomyces]KAB8171025.1 DNA polymerase/3'-5' exonuclease PolX [Streptomyces mimosae]KAB8179624.1 DNA polymerase/3'-5' exonuclease PolX [Streptomyces sp. 3MP-14]
MARPNDEVEALLREYADLIAITGKGAFKQRAYERAARAIGGHPADVATLDSKSLREIPGVGSSIADKVEEYLRTGRVAAVEETRASIPPGVRALLDVPTLGPKKAMTLYRELGVSSVDELAAALREDRLAELKGFGPKARENIEHGLAVLRQSGGRIGLDTALGVAEETVARLGEAAGCVRCAYAGSVRRMKETIGDIDVLAAADDPEPVMAAFCALPLVAEVVLRGRKKTTVRTVDGLQMDLRVLAEDSWGAGMIYFTGSKAHNIRIREIAVRKKLKLSEYGLFDAKTGRKRAARTEEEVYRRLGLPWIPPTLREDRGEVAAAQRDALPRLVTVDDLRGDLHSHTDLTDGIAPLTEMVAAAARRGYHYYAVTDHAPELRMQRMTLDKARAQREQLRQLAGEHGRLKLLHGTELNIDPEGNVDWPAEVLAEFELCVASIHSHFELDRDAQTRRLIRACENPHVNIIGHPTTRKFGRRNGIDADLDAVFAACARTGTALEINSHPNRLDLNDEHILRAREHGVRFSIDSDAHAPTHLGHVRFGVAQAQRGWLGPDDVINTWPLTRLRRFLRKTGAR